MFVANPGKPIVIVTDWRQRCDRDLDRTEKANAPHVLHLWKLGREALQSSYHRTTRIALFDHGETPSRQVVAARRSAFKDYVDDHKPWRMVVIPTPDAQAGEGASAVTGTACWAALQPPDNLAAMRLTRWRRGHTEVIAGYPIARRAKQLQVWAMGRALANIPLQCYVAPHTFIDPNRMALETLQRMAGKPLAIDLEFVPGRNLITAINLSDGVRCASMPFHAYTPRGHEERERGLADYEMGPAIHDCMRELIAAQTPKYCHNFVADVPLLERLGFHVGGAVMDTFAAHAIAFPELPHGLQTATASLLPIPPWKSEYKPRNSKGLNRDDEEYWMADPAGLREYGARDAFYTWYLARSVMPRVGIDANTGGRLESS